MLQRAEVAQEGITDEICEVKKLKIEHNYLDETIHVIQLEKQKK